jgi:type I restriction enzyme M protein
VYLHNESKTFVLWRLEHDGEYRPACQLPPGQEITPGNISRLIQNLIRIDNRRGFDPAAAVYAAQDEQARDAEPQLDTLAYAKYPQLTPAEIQALVIDDKWMAALTASVQAELDRLSQTLTGRLRELAERYANPLPELASEVEALTAKVAGHLGRMGVIWN